MDDTDYHLLCLRVNVCRDGGVEGLGGGGLGGKKLETRELVDAALGAVKMTDMGYKWARFYGSWKEDY